MAEPARDLMPAYGVTVPVPATVALPPPALIVSLPAPSPITAMEWTVCVSIGSTFFAFFSRTAPCSATSRAVVAWPGVEAYASDVSGNGCSNRPKRNSSRRIRLTMSLSRASGTLPSSTACLSGAPKKLSSGICMSMPALAEATVLCVAPQSDVMKPWKPSSSFRMPLR